MSRLGFLFSILLIVLALGGGSIAHASEGLACFEESRGSGWSDGDGDDGQVPPEAEKALAHHHGGCHGHHAGVSVFGGVRAQTIAAALRLSIVRVQAFVATGPDPALRPPQA